jgi:uncharacterized membrane protein YccC
MKIDLRNPDTWAALERQAYDGTVNLPPLPPPAYKYFSELTAVYRAFRFEGLDRQDAERKKALLKKAYDRSVQDLHRAREVYAAYQNAVRTAGMLLSEIEKAADIAEIADKACRAIALMTGDSSFYDRQHRKIESG